LSVCVRRVVNPFLLGRQSRHAVGGDSALQDDLDRARCGGAARTVQRGCFPGRRWSRSRRLPAWQAARPRRGLRPYECDRPSRAIGRRACGLIAGPTSRPASRAWCLCKRPGPGRRRPYQPGGPEHSHARFLTVWNRSGRPSVLAEVQRSVRGSGRGRDAPWPVASCSGQASDEVLSDPARHAHVKRSS
jgi:hypothetical protein